MARDEHQAQEVVAEVIVDLAVRIRHGLLLLGFELPPELTVFAIGHRAPAEMVERATLPDGHEPGTRVVREA